MSPQVGITTAFPKPYSQTLLFFIWLWGIFVWFGMVYFHIKHFLSVKTAAKLWPQKLQKITNIPCLNTRFAECSID